MNGHVSPEKGTHIVLDQDLVNAPWLDPRRSIDDRVADLLAEMTLDEKLAQLGSAWSFQLMDGSTFDVGRARERAANGIGQVTRPAGATNLAPHDVAELANAIQRFLVEETRLRIPAILHEECLHGVMAPEATCYPQSIGQAATWDPPLIERMGRQLGRRLRALGSSQGLAPVIDVARDPRWGRIEETYGEDPYLVAELGCAYIRGLQATEPGERPVIATGKHMVGHGLPEGGFNQGPVRLGERELHDVYLLPFEAAVREAGLGSMMHAYDELDGVPCVASRELLTTILRERWGFEGIVVSDYAGIQQLVDLHQVAEDLSTAAVLALEAGVDMDLPVTIAYGDPLRKALEEGEVEAATVDRAVSRVLAAKFRLGLFEQPYVDPSAADEPADEDRRVALEIARRSLVLIENDGILPLSGERHTIAVIGPNADSARNLVGDYGHVVHIETLLEMRGRDGVLGTAVPEDLSVADELRDWSTVLDALRRHAPTGTIIRSAKGCGVTDGDDAGIEAAAEAARGADVAVLVVGERSGLTRDCTCGELRDRMSLGLPGRQAELVAAVAATGTPIVLVLVAGRPLAIPDEAALASAVVAAWVPGEAGPEAIAEVLFGLASPGGKLPVTVPRAVGQVPIHHAHKPSGGRSNWNVEYVDGSNLPLWPFGHGLSYSRFELGSLRLDRARLTAREELAVSVDITNVGAREADEVVQLYVRDLAASVSRPVKELRGFARVTLEPTEHATVTFRIAAVQLAFTGLDRRLVVEPGRFRVMVGTSSTDLPCQAEFEVVGPPLSLDRRSRFLTAVSVARG
jgi:beta-glucosidase